MREKRILGYTLRNFLHTVLLFIGMLLILGTLAYIFGGWRAALWGVIGSIPLLLFSQQMSPQLMLRMYGAKPVAPSGAPNIYRILEDMADRAELPRTPRLYYIPSRMMNAFSVGRRDDAAIAVTDGMLRNLNRRELIGVLAHEIAHIRDGDMRVMAFADVISRITGLLSSLGQVLLILNLPLLLMGMPPISWFAVLLLMAAPTLTGLLQLALSRTRELQADISAARLSGDPEGLASALAKMERQEAGLLRRVLLPGYRVPDPSLFRTHPETEERIQRLLELRDLPHERVTLEDVRADELPADLPEPRTHPRWHITGLWH
ncbi:MAG: zinc metalloprotease HtpX [Anaerolineae bacterium]